MEIHKGYCFSASRSIKVNSEFETNRMKDAADAFIERFGEEEKYVYYVYTNTHYPGNCIFEIDVHAKWRQLAKSSNDPNVYINWRECEREADYIMDLVLKQFNKES